ncbi:MAG: hypothetical protein CVU59_06930 [Deltaproteobacteria bacterium HGW-Deltaproteobacteria-17]|nr:MAG: hypothetical protein CVU59_06930 [Deltaproteobacteria bacterium HGW-Deltaproteobacteria-17]
MEGGELRVEVKFTGLLAYELRAQEASYELAAGSLVSDLLAIIGRAFADRLPPSLYDPETETFHRMIALVRRDHGFLSPTEPLADGERLLMLSRAAGG